MSNAPVVEVTGNLASIVDGGDSCLEARYDDRSIRPSAIEKRPLLVGDRAASTDTAPSRTANASSFRISTPLTARRAEHMACNLSVGNRPGLRVSCRVDYTLVEDSRQWLCAALCLRRMRGLLVAATAKPRGLGTPVHDPGETEFALLSLT